MKFFIGALIILILTGTVCAWGTHESISRIDDMLNTLDMAETANGEVPPDALERAEKFEAQWEENMFLISMFLPHHHLDEVKEKLVSLIAYTKTDEFAEWQEAKMVLEEEMQHIRGLIRVSADNVF